MLQQTCFTIILIWCRISPVTILSDQTCEMEINSMLFHLGVCGARCGRYQRSITCMITLYIIPGTSLGILDTGIAIELAFCCLLISMSSMAFIYLFTLKINELLYDSMQQTRINYVNYMRSPVHMRTLWFFICNLILKDSVQHW